MCFLVFLTDSQKTKNVGGGVCRETETERERERWRQRERKRERDGGEGGEGLLGYLSQLENRDILGVESDIYHTWCFLPRRLSEECILFFTHVHTQQ